MWFVVIASGENTNRDFITLRNHEVMAITRDVADVSTTRTFRGR